MAKLPLARLRSHLAKADKATTAPARGKALEDYVCDLFGAIPGISIVARNAANAFGAEELDVGLWNDAHVRGLRYLPPLLLVECKNSNAPVGSAAVSYFAGRLRNRGCDYGFLIAANGITGDAADLSAAHFQLASALKDKIRIVVLTRAELESLTSTDEVCTLVKTRLCQLIASGTAN